MYCMATTFTAKFGQMFVISRMLLLVLNAPPSYSLRKSYVRQI